MITRSSWSARLSEAPSGSAPASRSSGPPRPQALGQARRPAPGRERAHERDVGGDHQAAGGEQLAQRRARQQAGVGGHEAPPAPAGQARGHRGGVRGDDAQHAAGAQQSRAALDRADGVVEVLEHVGEHDDVEALVVGEVLDRRLADVEAQRLARMARRRARELEADRLVAARARLVEQQPVPAADVEQPPAGDLGADQVEQARGGGAPPGLLAEVGVVAHLAVELVQLVAGGQQRLLHGAALHAGEQVAVSAGLVQRGRERLGHRGVRWCPRRAG